MKVRFLSKTVFSALSLCCPALLFADVISTVAVKTSYDDNIYRQDNHAVGSWVTSVSPGVSLVIDQGASSYTLSGNAQTGIYSQSRIGDDDYTDYDLSGIAKLQFNVRNSLELDIGHSDGHDLRGTGRTDQAIKSFGSAAYVTAQDIAEPDQWQRETLSATYIYGAEDALGRVAVSGMYNDTAYQNHRALTDVLDNTVTEFRATGYLGLLPRTSFLIEARAKDINYDKLAVTPAPVAGSSRDSSETKYFVGAEWKATAKTEGSIRVGYQNKDPDSNVFKSYSSTAWEADVVWRPRSYSALRFTATRGVDQSTNAITYVKTDVYSVNWRHGWSDSLNTEVYAQAETQNYENTENRTDKTDTFGVRGIYTLLEWLSLNTAYQYEQRSSSVAGLDFNRNVVSVGAEATFR